MVARIYVVRHGESTWNLEQRWTGHGDPPLTDTGRAQAQAACEALREHRFDAVISSTLVRAIETATIVAASLGLPRLPSLSLLNERFAGLLSGMPAAEIEARWPGLRDAWKAGTTVDIPGSEPWDAFVARIRGGLEYVQSNPGRILVVAHMGVLRAIEFMLGQPPTWYENLEGLWVPEQLG